MLKVEESSLHKNKKVLFLEHDFDDLQITTVRKVDCFNVLTIYIIEYWDFGNVFRNQSLINHLTGWRRERHFI